METTNEAWLAGHGAFPQDPLPHLGHAAGQAVRAEAVPQGLEDEVITRMHPSPLSFHTGDGREAVSW